MLEQDARDCRELDGALVFIVAMMVDPSLSLERLPPELLALVSSEVPAEARLLAELQTSPLRPTRRSIPQEPQPVPAPVPAPVPPAEVPKSEPPVLVPPNRYELRMMGLGEFQVAP